MKFDFEGWATKYLVKCSDGRTIEPGAFAHMDGMKVPVMWNHKHDKPGNVIGHAYLESRPEGLYAYGALNKNTNAKDAKIALQHGDVEALSIFATRLNEHRGRVRKGTVNELSVVVGGANPEALIENVMSHNHQDGLSAFITIPDYEEPVLYHTDGYEIDDFEDEDENDDDGFYHSDDFEDDEEEEENDDDDGFYHSDKDDSLAFAEIYASLDKNQRDFFLAMISDIINEQDSPKPSKKSKKIKHNFEEEKTMRQNAFLKHSNRTGYSNDAVFTANDVRDAVLAARNSGIGSMRESFVQHDIIKQDGVKYDGKPSYIFADDGEYLAHGLNAEGKSLAHGIVDIDLMFPDAQSVDNKINFITRDMEWVSAVLGGASKSPLPKLKALYANLTEDEARARGYIKGNQKVDQVFTMLKRTTTPTTIYKKQSIDQDDIIDIVDYDIVQEIKREMKVMLNEEAARAILVGDGRNPSSNDKINELCIRPIWTDESLYAINRVIDKKTNTTLIALAKAFIKDTIRARKLYKGSGAPTLFITEDLLSEMILLEDADGKRLYPSMDVLATAMRVSKIVSVPVMEGLKRTVNSVERELMGIIINMRDYKIGMSRKGEARMFDDFDIDFNKNKYLIETRFSGANLVPYSAMIFEAATLT